MNKSNWLEKANVALMKGQFDPAALALVQANSGGPLTMNDSAISVLKSTSAASTIKMFSANDKKLAGAGEVLQGKLAPGKVMVIDRIELLYGVSSDSDGTTEAAGKAVDFNNTDVPALVYNGNFEFKISGKTVIPTTSCAVFNQDKVNYKKSWELSNPIIINPSYDLEMNFEFAGTLASKSWLKVVFYGGSTAV